MDGYQIGLVSVYDTGTADGTPQIQSSLAEWHVRGNISRSFEKKGFRISLYTERGKANDVDFLGIRSDDDWMLDAMYYTPEWPPEFYRSRHLKEMLVDELWEQLRQRENSPNAIASSRYLELVLNGEYLGLYLMRSKIDAKLEKIDRNADIIFKCSTKNGNKLTNSDWTSLSEGDEVLACISLEFYPGDTMGAWETIRPFLQVLVQTDMKLDGLTADEVIEMVDLNNQIDNALMVNCLEMHDNMAPTNNIIYVYRKEEGKYYRLFWDFDLNLTDLPDIGGVNVKDECIYTQEIERLMELDRSVWPAMCARWRALREDIFTEANIAEILNRAQRQLDLSGVWEREQARWPNELLDLDGNVHLTEIVRNRLAFLDAYYQ